MAVVLTVLPFLSVNTMSAPDSGAPVAATPVTLLVAGVVVLELELPPPPQAVKKRLMLLVRIITILLSDFKRPPQVLLVDYLCA